MAYPPDTHRAVPDKNFIENVDEKGAGALVDLVLEIVGFHQKREIYRIEPPPQDGLDEGHNVLATGDLDTTLFVRVKGTKEPIWALKAPTGMIQHLAAETKKGT